jgi:hypothetical protein
MTIPMLDIRAQPHRLSRLGVLAAALVMAGCAAPAAQVSQGLPSGSVGGVPSASATPTQAAPTPTSSPSATPVPTLAFEAPAGVLPPDSLAVVTGDDLRIRETPGLGGRVVATVGAGEVLWMGGGAATVVDGIRWYLMYFVPGYRDWPQIPEGSQSGWVAAGAGDQRYLELLPPRCPDGEPDLAALTKLTGWERLACFGDHRLTVTGTFRAYGDGTTGATYEPAWLASPFNSSQLAVKFGASNPIVLLHFAPGSGLAYPTVGGSILRVDGHFSDPASTTCVISGLGSPDPLPGTAELICREQFVVDGYEVIGTDPDYRDPYAP